MDRNIITTDDAARARKAAFKRIHKPTSAGSRPDAMASRPGEPEPMDGGLDIDTKPDQWFQRLAKYVPSEAIGLYLALAGLISTNEVERYGLLALAALVGVCLVFNTLFLRRLWKVQRWSQVIVSHVALLTFVFATGGVLVQQLWFYGPRTATAALVLTTAFLTFFEPPSTRPAPSDNTVPDAADRSS